MVIVFNNIIRFSNNILFWSTALATTLFFLMILLNIVARFILQSPILGSVELSRLFFIWACFLGAAIGYAKNVHIAVSFVTDRFPEKIKWLLYLLINFISIVFFSLIAIESATLIKLLWHTSLPITKISQSWLYIPVPVSMAFMILYSLNFIKRLIAES